MKKEFDAHLVGIYRGTSKTGKPFLKGYFLVSDVEDERFQGKSCFETFLDSAVNWELDESYTCIYHKGEYIIL